MGSAGDEFRSLDLTTAHTAFLLSRRKISEPRSTKYQCRRVSSGRLDIRANLKNFLSTKYDEKSSLASAALG